MSARAARLGPGAQLGLVVAGLLLVAVAGYLLLVKPKRSEAARLDAEIAAVNRQIADRRSASQVRQVKAAVQTADLFKLAKAIPQDRNMAAALLELSRVASAAGIEFQTITPDAAVAGTGYHVLPITLAFTGNFFTLTDFLYRLRQLVQVRDGELDVTGRLFTVGGVSFSEDDERNFPFVKAEVKLAAFVFGDLPGLVGAVPAAPDSSTATETTTTTTTPNPNPNPAEPPTQEAAAPANPTN